MELYTTANIIKSIIATLAPYLIFVALYALLPILFPNLPKKVRRLME